MNRKRPFMRIMSAFTAGAGMPLPQRPQGVSLRSIWPGLGSRKGEIRAKTRRNKRRAKRRESARIAARHKEGYVHIMMNSVSGAA